MLSPLQSVVPMKTSAPIPAAINPGIRITGRVAPPRPDASMITMADRIGDPNTTEIAAKVPAAPRTISIVGGASRLARLTRKTATPPPMAIRGASGPNTSPRPIVASAARTTPGTMFGSVLATCRPLAGT